MQTAMNAMTAVSSAVSRRGLIRGLFKGQWQFEFSHDAFQQPVDGCRRPGQFA